MTKPLYNCGQQDLYSCCHLGWTSCSENLAAFTNFKNKYDPAFITTRLAGLAQAENLPGNQARAAISESCRIELVALAEVCRENFQILKRYIAEAFAPEMQKPQFEAAGQEYYLRASQNNWSAVESLNNFGDNYITQNMTKLSNDGYMPLAFAGKYNSDRVAFAAKHLQFMNSEEHEEEGTQAKIIANNGIYTELMNMCLDGQEIFKNDEAKYKQFVFAEILLKASGVGTAGIRGTIRNSATQLPIANANVQIIGTNKNTTSDEDGKYEIKGVATGVYDVLITAPGYEDLVMPGQEIITGTISTLNVLMVPLP